MQTRRVDVRAVDVADQRLTARFHQVIESADTYERPWSPMWSLDELRVLLRQRVTWEQWCAFAAFDAEGVDRPEHMVRAGYLTLPLLDNVEKAYAGSFVEPGLRRRGIVSALLEHAVQLMKERGRTTILSESGCPGDERDTHPYVRFARRNGFAVADVEVHRHLDLPVPVDRIRAMQAEATPYHEGYRIETFDDEIPDDLLESYCHLENLLALEAPTGDIDFEAVADTDWWCPGGMRTEIHTTNSETRATMIGINERLGFRVVEICPVFQRRL
jgi:GNAT superfamily N-acetyltransferase